MKDRCQTAICSFTKMLITSLEWYRREINQQHSKEAQCVPIENKEKLFSTQDRCSSWCAFRNLWIKSSSSFWGYKLMLWARLSLFFNVSFVCSQRTEARDIGQNLSKLQSGWIQLRQVWFQLLRTVYLWPDLECFSVAYLNSKTAFEFRWFVSYVNHIWIMKIWLPVTFRVKGFFHYVMLKGVSI